MRTQMPRLHARPFTSTFFIAKDAPMVCAAHAAACLRGAAAFCGEHGQERHADLSQRRLAAVSSEHSQRVRGNVASRDQFDYRRHERTLG